MVLVHKLSENFSNKAIITFNTELKVEKLFNTSDFCVNLDAKNRVHSVVLKNAEKHITDYNTKHNFFSLDLVNLTDLLHILNVNQFEYSDYKKFVKGKILDKQSHPKSEKLFIIEIEHGEEKTRKIVTNSAEVQIGDEIFFIMPGSIIYDGTEIVNGQVMGIDSPGMLLSYKSLGLEKEYRVGLVKNDNLKIGEELKF
ncbi:TyrS-associated PheT N-terminal domain-related protein TapR [Mycoplasma anserisalpingitidis]|uniref:TyrS-associated PheT N-terminal domain-related protein TapR n=1 Tax=Mycoplasma anserisalpingitidis TaxID=519450 RepID=UPI001CF64645|nr:hypothetical protein [Mycoplasma anserisalpingitidis]UCU26526.1 hypothetical protein K7D06_02915 [Mycoplasma anserisalpingitidis]UCU27363.1 hypothetical protein K9O38_03580 [Mycoplasma anserisalpingitidis]